MVAIFAADAASLIVLEPLAIDRTRFITYELMDCLANAPGRQERSANGLDIINAGGADDGAKWMQSVGDDVSLDF